MRWGERHYQFNNLGARDDADYSLKSTPGKRRLTFIGDSFTAGHGVEDVQQRFANRIGAAHPQWEVHCMAANGTESVDHLHIMEKLARDGYDFDQIVLVYNLNDIAYLMPEALAIYQRMNAFKDEMGFLERESYFINTLSFRMFAAKDPDLLNYFDFVLKAYSGPEWEQQKRMFGQLQALSFPVSCQLQSCLLLLDLQFQLVRRPHSRRPRHK